MQSDLSHSSFTDSNILVIITTLDDDPSTILRCIRAQTTKVKHIVVVVGSYRVYKSISKSVHQDINYIFVKPNFSESLGIRLGKAINAALSTISIEKYDYVIKIDADVIIPSNFIEINMKKDADIIGKFGYCIILKTSSFLKVLNGDWPELTTEDTYIINKFLWCGYNVTDLQVEPYLKRKGGARYSWRNQFERGVSMYKLGCEPFHVFAGSLDLKTNPRTIFVIFGYVFAVLRRVRPYEFANFIFNNQVKQFFNFKKLSKSLKYI